MKLREIAAKLGCKLLGNGAVSITGVAGLEHAGPTELTFLANPRYAGKVRASRAAAILVTEPLESAPMACLVSENPYLDFARALELFYQPPRPAPGVHETAVIAPTATIGENASIGACCVIGEHVKIGRNAVLHPHVVLYEGVTIGDDFRAHSQAVVREFCEIGHRVILQNGVVIGGDGFGFAKRADGTHYKIVQSGRAVIEDDVEIQALSAVDRASVGESRIKRGAKLDNLVQIGHAGVVGEDNIICAQVGLAGSSILDRDVLLAGQVGIAGHLKVGRGVIATAQSGVPNSVEDGLMISGYPAIESKRWRRAVAAFPRLPELVKKIRKLERRLEQLEPKPAEGNQSDE